MTALDDEAKRRHQSHINHPTHRPLSHDYELVGLVGEKVFSFEFGGEIDLSPRPGGDKGHDFLFGEITVDVKTARKAYNLIVEVGKVRVDVLYVLGSFDDRTQSVCFLGWEWGHTLIDRPTKDFGHGVINHYIPKKKLQKIPVLKRILA